MQTQKQARHLQRKCRAQGYFVVLKAAELLVFIHPNANKPDNNGDKQTTGANKQNCGVIDHNSGIVNHERLLLLETTAAARATGYVAVGPRLLYDGRLQMIPKTQAYDTLEQPQSLPVLPGRSKRT